MYNSLAYWNNLTVTHEMEAGRASCCDTFPPCFTNVDIIIRYMLSRHIASHITHITIIKLLTNFTLLYNI